MKEAQIFVFAPPAISELGTRRLPDAARGSRRPRPRRADRRARPAPGQGQPEPGADKVRRAASTIARVQAGDRSGQGRALGLSLLGHQQHAVDRPGAART
jgi:hypothetical protein